jgi:hypothetical protein
MRMLLRTLQNMERCSRMFKIWIALSCRRVLDIVVYLPRQNLCKIRRLQWMQTTTNIQYPIRYACDLVL